SGRADAEMSARVRPDRLREAAIERLDLRRFCSRRDDLKRDDLIAGRGSRQSAPAQPELAARLRALRNLDLDGAAERRDGHRRAEGRLPGQDRPVEVDVTALGPEERVRRQPDDCIKIASLPAGDAGAALGRQPDTAPVRDTGRNADVQRARALHDAPGMIDFRDRDRQRLRRAVIGLLERQCDRRLIVLAPGRERERAAAAGAEAGLTEQALEEIAEGAGAGRTGAAEMKMLLPVRRRPELLTSLPIRAERVVRGPLLGVAQDLVGLADLLEALLGVRLLADVRVILARKAAVGALDLVLRRVPGDAHDLVVVLVLHTALVVGGAGVRSDGLRQGRWGLTSPESRPKRPVFPNLAIQSPPCGRRTGSSAAGSRAACCFRARSRRRACSRTASRATTRPFCCARAVRTSAPTCTSGRSTWSPDTTICCFSPASSSSCTG